MADYIPNKVQDLINLAQEIKNDKELKSWLWTHTMDEDHYHSIIRALSFLGNINLVKWENCQFTPIRRE